MQEPDFAAGANFVLEIDRAAKEAARTIAVLSADYLKASFTQPEWAAAFARDPTGAKKRLVLIRVKPCEVKGLLRQVVYIDIVGLDIERAGQCILDQLAGKSAGGKAPAAAKAPKGKGRTAKTTRIRQTATAGRDVFQAAGDLNLNKKEVVRPVIPREQQHITEAQAAEIRQRLNELGSVMRKPVAARPMGHG